MTAANIARIAILGAAATAALGADTLPARVGEIEACEVLSFPRLGLVPNLTLRSLDAQRRPVGQRCDGCDGRGMDGVQDVVRTVARGEPRSTHTVEVVRGDEGAYFSESVTWLDASGCAVGRWFWIGTPQDWALDLTTCDAHGRPVLILEDMPRGLPPLRLRTLRRDDRGRVVEETYDRDYDGDAEERTRWRYDGMSVPVRRDWYLDGELTARSTYARAADGRLLVERYDYRADGVIDVTLLYGYGCAAR